MKEEFRKMLSELAGAEYDVDFKAAFEREGLDNDFITSLMLCKQLKQIADMLEDINGTLIRMEGSVELLEKLADCVDEIPQYGNRFVVGGMVQVEQK